MVLSCLSMQNHCRRPPFYSTRLGQELVEQCSVAQTAWSQASEPGEPQLDCVEKGSAWLANAADLLHALNPLGP
eukprot:1603788-Amphidinium_carterae.2